MNPILDGSILLTSIFAMFFIMSCGAALFRMLIGTALATATHCVKLVLDERLLPKLPAVFLSILLDELEFPSEFSRDSLSPEFSWFKDC